MHYCCYPTNNSTNSSDRLVAERNHSLENSGCTLSGSSSVDSTSHLLVDTEKNLLPAPTLTATRPDAINMFRAVLSA